MRGAGCRVESGGLRGGGDPGEQGEVLPRAPAPARRDGRLDSRDGSARKNLACQNGRGAGVQPRQRRGRRKEDGAARRQGLETPRPIHVTISPRGRHDPLGPAHSPRRRAMSGFPAPCAPDARGIPGREDAQRLQTQRRVAAIPPAEGGRARAPGGEREAAGRAGRVVGLPERVWDCTRDIHGGGRGAPRPTPLATRI